MENVIYSKLIVPMRESHDGETPTQIELTEEINCFLLWRTGYDGNVLLNNWDKYSRTEAIEEAVREAKAEFLEHKERTAAEGQ
jgi:hypothetical protein